MVWNRGVHMDPEIYSNPKEYDPSRWEVCTLINIENFVIFFNALVN